MRLDESLMEKSFNLQTELAGRGSGARAEDSRRPCEHPDASLAPVCAADPTPSAPDPEFPTVPASAARGLGWGHSLRYTQLGAGLG